MNSRAAAVRSHEFDTFRWPRSSCLSSTSNQQRARVASSTLLSPPALQGGIGAFVSIVALRAMDVGHLNLWALSTSSVHPPNIAMQASSRQGGSPPSSGCSFRTLQPFILLQTLGFLLGSFDTPVLLSMCANCDLTAKTAMRFSSTPPLAFEAAYKVTGAPVDFHVPQSIFLWFGATRLGHALR